MPALWPCSAEDCQFPAVQRAGDCLLCGKHLCRVHLQDQWHKCARPETNWNDYSAQYAAAEARRLGELCKSIDSTKLCARASQVRSGEYVPCAIDLLPQKISAMMGGQNCHAEITFEDGVVWLARFRLSSLISPPREVRDYVLRSEAATMKFLECHTRIPSPRIFDWACESDPENTIGMGYILMEKLHGTPLDWQAASTTQREKVVQQLADIMLELEKHPFDQLGSLITTAAPIGDEAMPELATVKPPIRVHGLAQHSTFHHDVSGMPPGPFLSSRVALRKLIETYLQKIANGEIGTVENATDVFLTHRFRLDVLDKAWEQSATLGGSGKETFFLKHADDKGDHILVNDDFEIVGIIDWEWCSTASKEVAFSSPCMMWPVAAFYDGSNELAQEELFLAHAFRERGRDDLARCVLNGRKVQRLLFALGPGGASHENKKTFACLFMGLRRAFACRHDTSQENRGAEEQEWEDWKANALEMWKHDDLLQAVLGSELCVKE
ncbi:hypothetical protein LLEC1_01433 [Akanthomyces lecanii]|uniref:Aminoglycoside phosphotransferase domain-containing protein n=1 Tax=Cordyceps confragosa TaxID=2714763 RepID=A0A179I5S5_CORDF|nr:hypothetical protein LLEC1_01433 [Akanthomyces lecanii]